VKTIKRWKKGPVTVEALSGERLDGSGWGWWLLLHIKWGFVDTNSEMEHGTSVDEAAAIADTTATALAFLASLDAPVEEVE